MPDNEPKPPAPGKTFWLGTSDDEFVRELMRRYLPDTEKTMPRVLIRGIPQDQEANLNSMRIPRSIANTNVASGDPHIYLNSYTPEYRKAREGDEGMMKKLASAIAHENQHIYTTQEPGSVADEAAAYETQLNTLRRLLASPNTIRDVERSRDAVTKGATGIKK